MRSKRIAKPVRISLRATDDDLVRIGDANPGFQIERDADGAILVSPTKGGGGAKSGKAYRQLDDYAQRVGGKALDSSAGFAIGPGAVVKSPDASWVSAARIAALSQDERDGFWPLSPDIAIEVKSKTDRWSAVLAKIDEYITRGSRYAVAVNPETRDVAERGAPPEGLALDFDAIIDA